MCDCKICTTNKTYKRIVNTLESAADKEWMEAFLGHYLNVAEDLEYHKTVIGGEWPSSIKILTKALKQAKAKFHAH